MKDIMIDIETLGNSSNAMVVQIAAAFFNRNNGKIEKEFIVNITQSSCYNIGLTKDKSTIDWWAEQSDEAKAMVFGKDLKRVSIKKALTQLNEFINGEKCIVWSHSSFDFPILDNAFRKSDIKFPFQFYKTMDLRTIVALSRSNNIRKYPKMKSVSHYALADVRHQIKYALYYLKKMGVM